MLITPAVRTLARAWPGAKIDFLGSTVGSAVFENLPFVRQVGSLSKKTVWCRGWLGPKKYDLAIVYGYDGDGVFVRYALRMAEKVIAFQQREEELNRKMFAFVNKSKLMPANSVEHFLSLVRPLGIETDGHYLSYAVSDEERAWAGRRLAGVRQAGAMPIVGVQIASFPTRGYRDWPLRCFTELCGRIRNSHATAHFLILGGALERKRTLALHAALPDASTHLAGTLTLRETAAVMAQLDLYVGVDTGPTHIMGALHRPMVAIYHPVSPSNVLGPLEHPCCHVVDHPQLGRVPPEDLPMSDITVDSVMTKVEEALQGRFPPPRSR